MTYVASIRGIIADHTAVKIRPYGSSGPEVLAVPYADIEKEFIKRSMGDNLDTKKKNCKRGAQSAENCQAAKSYHVGGIAYAGFGLQRMRPRR
jgi:hypothetical protein